MIFNSWTDFFAMGTHGPYVWSVYGISLFLLVALTIQSFKAKQTQLKRLQKIILREQIANASS